MTIVEWWNKTFHRSECINVIIFKETKRASNLIIRVGNKQEFKIGECAYIIDNSLVYSSGGLPLLAYYHNNSNPIDPVKSKATEFTAELFNRVFEQEIVKDIVKTNTDEGTSLKTLMYVGMAINVIGLVGLGYILNQSLEEVKIFMLEATEVLNLIKDYLLNGIN